MFRSFDIRISSKICILIFQFTPNKYFFNGLISRLFATRMWQLLPVVMKAVSYLLLPIFLLCSTIIITQFSQRVQDQNPVLIIAFLPAALTNIFKRTDFPNNVQATDSETPLILTVFSTPRFWREISLSN
jgi:hypothetical protein